MKYRTFISLSSLNLLLITMFVLLATTVPGAAQELQHGTAGATNIAAAGTENPVPLINEPLVPDAAAPGGAGFTLTVNGTGFVSGAVVKWNGNALATTFVSGSRLKATVLPSNVANAGTASVTVVNPAPGGGTSNTVFLEVTIPSSSMALSAPTDFSLGTGSSPAFGAVGDFNGDGKLDLAVADQNTGNVSVLLGNGNGTFQPHVDYATGRTPLSVVVGDFNRDGKLDLAVTNESDNTVSVLLGNGDGTFQAAVRYGTGSSPYAVAVGDFNSDGKLDLVVANIYGNNVSVLLGNGDGTFQAAANYDVGMRPTSIAVGDFNGDGKLDLAVTNLGGNNVSVLLGMGDGTFSARVDYATGSGPNSVALADFNGDGKLDLAVTNQSDNTISVLLGNGDGTFQPPVNYSVGTVPASVAIGDFNGDAKLDLAVANGCGPSGCASGGSVSILLGNGDGTFQAHADYATPRLPALVAVGDFNGGGRLDVAVANYVSSTVSVLLQAPAVSLSKTNLPFANQLIGASSAAQNVTLTNTSGFTLTVDSVTVTGTNAGEFEQTNDCSSGLLPGFSCTITITFTPIHIGPRSAFVTITDDATGSPQAIALSGTGVVSGANVTLSTTSLTFSTQVMGTTSPAQSITLSNYGTATLSITTISFTGADPRDFLQTNTCYSSVAPGARCALSISFKPTQLGSRAATLSLTDNAPGSSQTVGLNGSGTVVVMQLNPNSLSFGYHTLYTFHSLSTTLTNISSTALSITGITITGASDEFFLQTNTCGFSVGPGQSCTLTVTFRPTEWGNDYANISISVNGNGNPQNVALWGAGCSPIQRCN